MIRVMSFSYRMGVPKNVDMVFNCRVLRNPHLVPRLRELTGKHPAVQEYVLADSNALLILKDALESAEDGMTIAFGCYGGRHRSVTMAEKLAEELKRAGSEVELVHRDL